MYHSPMSLIYYPFDDFDVDVQLALVDTSRSVPGHPGLTVEPSSASVQVRQLDRVHVHAGQCDVGGRSCPCACTCPPSPHVQGAHLAKHYHDLTNGWQIAGRSIVSLHVYTTNRSTWYMVNLAAAHVGSCIAHNSHRQLHGGCSLRLTFGIMRVAAISCADTCFWRPCTAKHDYNRSSR